MSRITNQQLQQKVDHLNTVSGAPMDPWTREGDRWKANIGNYHISGAYGGVAVHKMMSDGGGITDLFGRGYMPKRELYNLLTAYLDGVAAGR